MGDKTLLGWILRGEMRGTQNPATSEFERSDCNRKCYAYPTRSVCPDCRSRWELRVDVERQPASYRMDYRKVVCAWSLKSKEGCTRQVVYDLTSLTSDKASPEKLLMLTCQYWGIEKGLYYCRDATLHEGASRLTIGNSGHCMATLNNLTIGLCFDHGWQLRQGSPVVRC